MFMNFNVYFFRESQKTLDFDRILAFFSKFPEITYEVKDENGIFTYYDETLDTVAKFIISRKLLVPNIFKIKPNFININFHMEIDSFLPTFKVDMIFYIIQSFCEEFGLFIYNELFENAVEFNLKLLQEVYQYFKTVCKEKFPEEYKQFYYLDETKLGTILNYQKANYELQVEYLNENIVAPSYIFLLDSFNIVRTAIKWKEGTDIIIPPCLDYIYFEQANLETHLYAYNDCYDAIDKYLTDLPGFQRGTKIVDVKENKKIKKIMRKGKFKEINNDFKNIKIGLLTDI